ncbi:MAG: hypothetical protein H0X62_15325, partial [Bacteroidetes bacterium]|nr:hypothetical protein [Bacteroidota bacterium]
MVKNSFFREKDLVFIKINFVFIYGKKITFVNNNKLTYKEMKKNYLLTGISLICSFSFAQNSQQSDVKLEETFQLKVSDSDHIHPEGSVPSGLSSLFSNTNLRAMGDTIWINDFSAPSDWVASSPTPHGWGITSTNKGWYYSSSINSTSGGNYALLENGNPATNSPAPIAGPFTLTTANPVNLSLNPDVLLTYQIYGARFQDTLQVQVSTNGTTFTTVGNHHDWSVLSSAGGSASANPENRSINISAQAGGQPQVWVRFRWIGGSGANGNITYGYMIDDVAFIEASANDLILNAANYTKVWDNGQLEYSIYPLNQAQANPLTFEAAIANQGSSNQSNVALISTVTQVGGTTPVYTNNTPYGT